MQNGPKTNVKNYLCWVHAIIVSIIIAQCKDVWITWAAVFVSCGAGRAREEASKQHTYNHVKKKKKEKKNNYVKEGKKV